MTGYMHTMVALCVLNDYVSSYKVIFIIYLPLNPVVHCNNEIATFTAVDENGRCNNNGI